MRQLEKEAIAWFATDNRLKPRLSPYPIIEFIDAQGDMIRVNILVLETQYLRWRKKKKS